MRLQMTTEFMHLVEPGLYGTTLGDYSNHIMYDHLDDFRNAVVKCGIKKINEILSEDSFVRALGECKAENGEMNSPQFYNYENDSIEFDLIVPDTTIEIIRRAGLGDYFFKWAKEKFGSHDGFISFFPYEREKFEKALKTDGLDLSRAIAMLIMLGVELFIGEAEMERHQRDFEDDVIETAYQNNWFEDEEEDN